MDQAEAGFHKPGQQQRLLFPVETGNDHSIKDICSPEDLIFKPARLKLDWSALKVYSNQKERSSLILKCYKVENII